MPTTIPGTMTTPRSTTMVTTAEMTTTGDPRVTLDIGAIVGIALAVLVLLLVMLLILIVIIFCCWRTTVGQGFYKTYETNDSEVPVVHYSASLKELSEEVVTNGQLPAGSMTNGGHTKEFYL